jgi:MFS superfamily sulfate permease-like transporter
MSDFTVGIIVGITGFISGICLGCIASCLYFKSYIRLMEELHKKDKDKIIKG